MCFFETEQLQNWVGQKLLSRPRNIYWKCRLKNIINQIVMLCMSKGLGWGWGFDSYTQSTGGSTISNQVIFCTIKESVFSINMRVSQPASSISPWFLLQVFAWVPVWISFIDGLFLVSGKKPPLFLWFFLSGYITTATGRSLEHLMGYCWLGYPHEP